MRYINVILIGVLILFVGLNSVKCQVINTEDAVTKVLNDQENAWNTGDITKYMEGYWKNDSLKFIGKSGIQYGWQQTIDNYKKSYPDKATMGSLKFEIVKIETLSNSSAFVVGKWALTREKGNVNGYFTLLFKLIEGNWVIVCDHSS